MRIRTHCIVTLFFRVLSGLVHILFFTFNELGQYRLWFGLRHHRNQCWVIVLVKISKWITTVKTLTPIRRSETTSQSFPKSPPKDKLDRLQKSVLNVRSRNGFKIISWQAFPCHAVPLSDDYRQLNRTVFIFAVSTVCPNACMMTTSNGTIFRVTGPLWGEFTGQRWIPLTKASDAELWCFLWSSS